MKRRGLPLPAARSRLVHRVAAGVLACCAAAALAQPAALAQRAASRPPVAAASDDASAWHQLSAAQREALAPLQHEWPRLDASSRRKWLVMAARFPQMPEAERERIQERMRDWAALTPQQRGKARLHFREARELPKADRQAKWQAYQELTPEQKKQLAARAASSRHPKKNRVAPPPPAASDAAVAARDVAPPEPLAPRSVAPTVLQVRPGATTIPVSGLPGRPLIDTRGVSKIVAGPELIDPATLLPRRKAPAR